jgi:small-conductance mechanosensitive channel
MRRLRRSRERSDEPGGRRRFDPLVTPDFRRAVIFSVLALAALIGGERFGRIDAQGLHAKLGAWACALLVVVLGILASRAGADETERIIAARASSATGSSVRLIVLLTGYVITLFAVLDLLALPVNYFTGGTVAALVIGIAAQQVLGNVFAGLVLLFARPYVPGERVRVHSGALGGPHEGIVTAVGLLYTTVQRDDGVINIPNSALLASAVGPAPAVDTDEDEEDPDIRPS